MKSKVNAIASKLNSKVLAAAVTLSMATDAMAVVPGAAGIGFDAMIGRFKGVILSFSDLVTFGAGGIGVSLIVFGIYKGYEASKENSHVKTKEIVVPLFIGGALLSVSVIVNMMAETAGGAARVGTAIGNF